MALCEAVLNALVHWDYYERGAQIMVEVYDNRVEITKNQQNILQTISEEATITVPRISEKLGIAKATVEKNMQRLKELELLERVGSNKTGTWAILFQYPDK